MKKIIFCFIGLLLFCSVAFADKGVVVKEHDDKYAIEYNLGYLLVEWYGGYTPSEGDTYAGDFSGYGMKELYCINADEVTTFYVEDYMADEDAALEFLFD
jgi:hypothetical protein